jgi:hypothetical protein
MPIIRYATKNAARAASRSFLLGTTAFGVLGTVLGLVAGADYGAASGSLISISLGYLGQEAHAAADDPPRPDYSTSTRSKRRHLPSAAGDSAVARQSDVFGQASAYAAAYLSAFVRALERSQMAELHEEFETMRMRLREADEYAARAANALNLVSQRGLVVADAFAADDFLRREARKQFEGSAGRQRLDTPYWEKLPPDLMAIFEESDIDPRSLRADWQEAWQPSDPVASCARVLRSVSKEATGLADSLREWKSEDPSERVS